MSDIKRIKEENHGFIASDDDLADVVRENRLQPLLVRCGNGRFVCPAQDVETFVRMVNADDQNYVRDISFPVNQEQIMKEEIRKWLLNVSHHLVRVEIAKRKQEEDERSKIIDAEFLKDVIMNGYQEIKMDFNIKVTAKKDGRMNDNGTFFCYKGKLYDACILPGDDKEGDFYYVMDENNNDPLAQPHGMDKEFFDEYFDLPMSDKLYFFLKENSAIFRGLSMDRQGEIISDAIKNLYGGNDEK